MNAKDFLKTGQVARIFDCSPDTVHRLNREGKLTAIRLEDGERLFQREQVENMAAERHRKRSEAAASDYFSASRSKMA